MSLLHFRSDVSITAFLVDTSNYVFLALELNSLAANTSPSALQTKTFVNCPKKSFVVCNGKKKTTGEIKALRAKQFGAIVWRAENAFFNIAPNITTAETSPRAPVSPAIWM